MTYPKTFALLFALLLIPSTLVAQEEADAEVDDRYAAYLSGDAPDMDAPEAINDTFAELMLINTPTVKQLPSKTLWFNIQHRFGQVSSKTEEMFGIYAPANIRLALAYGLTDWLQVGVGSAKNGSYQDLNWKFRLLQQETNGGMPVSLTYYGQGTLQAGPSELYDKFSHRTAHFHQLMLARKFGYYFSLQIAPSVMHFNIVDEAGGHKHDNFGISVLGKLKVTTTSSVIFEAAQGQLFYSPDEGDSKPVLSLGYEVETTGHSFQVFASSTNHLTPHQLLAYNPYDFTEGEFFLGFNMTRNWNF